MLSAETRELLGKVGVSTLTTCLFRRGLRNVWLSGLHPVVPGLPNLVGPAYTLRFIPAREDLGGMASYATGPNPHQRAFEECPEGHVLVLATGNETRCCCCGDLLIGRLKTAGAAGIVTDGGFRDGAAVAALGFPAYQRQSAPAPSFLHLHAVDTQLPVACAGVAIMPGDVMVGDCEGVVVIPVAMADEVAQDAWWLTRYDAFAAARIAAGRSVRGLYPPTDTSRAEFDAWETSA